MQTISFLEGFNYAFMVSVREYEATVTLLRKAKFDCTYDDVKTTGSELIEPKVRITVYCANVTDAALIYNLLTR